MSKTSKLNDDEINFGELIATVWSHKFLITILGDGDIHYIQIFNYSVVASKRYIQNGGIK